MLFNKSYKCPICDEQFKVPTVRAGKAKLEGVDADLRPRYKIVDPLKYDIVMCPKCGYATLTRFFSHITPPQAKLIKQGITRNFIPMASQDSYTYDEAFLRYQLALGNAVVKRGKASEKAYLCLKMAWLLRGKLESLDQEADNYDEEVKKIREDEKELLASSLEGFISARQTENFPMCGMDESTVEYLIAVMSMKFEKYDTASKMISSILMSQSANARIKDRCRDIKEQLVQIMKEAK